jgi:hypothetical protein
MRSAWIPFPRNIFLNIQLIKEVSGMKFGSIHKYIASDIPEKQKDIVGK